MEKCHLYVLRYDYSGNYYVGSTTKDLKTRMETHLKENRKKTPWWSCANKSSKRFKYYWFCVDKKDNSHRNEYYNDKEIQSIGDRCENVLMDLFSGKIEEIKNCNPNREVHAIGGSKTKKEDYKIEGNGSIYDSIDEKLEIYLKSFKSFEVNIKQGTFCISFWREGRCE